MQQWIVYRITAGKGINPYIASILLKVIINAILGFETKFIPMSSNYIGQTFMNQLEYIQRRAISAIMGLPFCSIKEIIEMEL